MLYKGIQFQNVSFQYISQVQPLFENFSAHFVNGWTGITGANGAGKTTLLKLAIGELEPMKGSIHTKDRMIYCPQRTDQIPNKFEDFLFPGDALSHQLMGNLKIEFDWYYRWDSLSHGERKRVQLAVALWQEPDLLAIDEPTNHIDYDAKKLVLTTLKNFKGTGLIISHDRLFLDSLCSKCVFIDPPEILIFNGGYSEGLKQKEMIESNLSTQFVKLKRETKKIEKEISKRRDEANRANKKRSKKGLHIKDHDSRDKKNLARVSGKDGHAGKLMNQLKGRHEHLRNEKENITIKKKYDMGIWLQGNFSRKDYLFQSETRQISLGERKTLNIPDLDIRPSDKIALIGPNGTGKSTLLKWIVEKCDLQTDKLIYLPQEIDLRNSQLILNEIKSLSHEKLGLLLTIVNRLGSDPKRILESQTPSPGELRKILLALGITFEPYLIIMDEPTNHLDLPSIECLEEALEDCPCGLLLVSHDYAFLKKLTSKVWEINLFSGVEYSLKVYNW